MASDLIGGIRPEPLPSGLSNGHASAAVVILECEAHPGGRVAECAFADRLVSPVEREG
jgi:hypothetical protein